MKKNTNKFGHSKCSIGLTFTTRGFAAIQKKSSQNHVHIYTSFYLMQHYSLTEPWFRPRHWLNRKLLLLLLLLLLLQYWYANLFQSFQINSNRRMLYSTCNSLPYLHLLYRSILILSFCNCIKGNFERAGEWAFTYVHDLLVTQAKHVLQGYMCIFLLQA